MNSVDDLSTIISMRYGLKKVGEYTNGGDACKMFIKLYYYDLKKQIIFHEKKFLGGEPPSSIRTRSSSGRYSYKQGGIGDAVSEEVVINYIRHSQLGSNFTK